MLLAYACVFLPHTGASARMLSWRPLHNNAFHNRCRDVGVIDMKTCMRITDASIADVFVTCKGSTEFEMLLKQ